MELQCAILLMPHVSVGVRKVHQVPMPHKGLNLTASAVCATILHRAGIENKARNFGPPSFVCGKIVGLGAMVYTDPS